MNKTPRQVAAESGSRIYIGKLCKRCGNDVRITANATCRDCLNEGCRIAVKKRRVAIKALLDAAAKL
jgi:hypothetical protein